MKRLSAFILVIVLLSTSFPTMSYAHGNHNHGNKYGHNKWNDDRDEDNNNQYNNVDINLYDRDDTINQVSVYADNGTYVGIDSQIDEEPDNAFSNDDVRDNNDSEDIYPNNPYLQSNGKIRVIIENVYGRSWIEVEYNGRRLDDIRSSQTVVLYVNKSDQLKVTTHDNPDWQGDYSSWIISDGYYWYSRNDDDYTIDFSDIEPNQCGYIYMTPWYGSGSSDIEYEVTYDLANDAHGAFGINPQNGRVFVKDSSALVGNYIKDNTVRVKVKVTRNSKSTTKWFDIILDKSRTPVVSVPDVGVVNPGVIETVYASDHSNNVFMINLEDKTTTKVSDTNKQWFDIANDNSTVLYGVVSNGDLYKNILDPNNTERDDVGNVRESGKGVINSLTVDDYGNMYFVDNAVLKYYNVFSTDADNAIQTVMKLSNSSLGDLVFHKGKLYYAAFKNNSSKGSSYYYGSLVEIDTERQTTREVGNIPRTTYGLASVNDKLYLLHGKTVSEFDFDAAAVDTNFVTEPYSTHMNIGSNASSIYGSAQGDTIATGNLLANDSGENDAIIKAVDNKTVQANGDYTFVYGYYGVLLIKPDGTYIYVMDSKSNEIKYLYNGETLDETFTYVAGYEGEDATSVSTLTFTINAYDAAANKPKGGIRLDAYDIDGNGVKDENVVDGQSVREWHDSIEFDNVAVARGSAAPKLDLDGIYGHRAVDFDGYAKGMNIAKQEEVNDDKFIQKTIGTVFKTGDSVEGIQYIFEEGGGWRGYNFAIAPNPQDGNDPWLYAMVYNNKEWDQAHYYKSIPLTEVEEETVYFAFMAHDATQGTFRAYINGSFTDVTETQVLTSVREQEAHPNPSGVGWYNSHTVYPHTFENITGNGDGGAPFDGMIGEIISWNKALTFAEIQELNGELMTKWKPLVVDPVENITTVQSGAELEVTWTPVPGIASYEVIISTDNRISDDDVVYTANDKKKDIVLSAEILNRDDIHVFVRYEVGAVNSEDASANHEIYGQPQDFTYTKLEDDKTLFRFTAEAGKAYVVRYNGISYPVPVSKGYAVLSSDQIIDPAYAELYETAKQASGPDFDLGHGLKAEGPAAVELASVIGLSGEYSNGSIDLSWNTFAGTAHYEIKVGAQPDNMQSAGTSTRPSYAYDELDISDSVFKYFKVRAKVEFTGSGESGYSYSGYSNVVPVLTPVYGKLVDSAMSLLNGSVEGPGVNGLYETNQYASGAKVELEAAIESANSALAKYRDGTIGEAELESAYEALEQALADFEDEKITSENRIKFYMNDDSGNPLSRDLVVGNGVLQIVDGSIEIFGPPGFELTLDLSIPGFSLDGAGEYAVQFTNQPQEFTLSYGDSLPTAIDMVDAGLDALGEYKLGPIDNQQDEEYGFYEVGQYHGPFYNALENALKRANAMNNDPNATGADKNAMADELKAAWNAFKASVVTSSNKMTLTFLTQVNGEDVSIQVDGSEFAERFGPEGVTVNVNGPFTEENPVTAPFVDNYYMPAAQSFAVTFGAQPGTQKIYFVKTPLYVAVLEAEGLVETAVTGPGDDGYQPGELVKGAVEELSAVIDAARSVLDDPKTTQEEKENAASALSDAINAFEANRISEDNRIEIQSISGETGELLGTKTVYGPKGYIEAVSIEVIDNYQPYVDPEVRATGAETPVVYDAISVEFTDAYQLIHVMYREDEKSNLPSAAKTDWRSTAEASILYYAEINDIPWRDISRYDIDDSESDTHYATAKEYLDFLNILGNALLPADQKFIDEEFAGDYIEDIEADASVIENYGDLIDMLEKYYREISDAFYSTNPGTGSNNEKLEAVKTIYYEDPINTSVVFKIKDPNITEPEFHFELIGNEYLSYDYPTIELYKLDDDQDPAEDPSVLNKGEIQPSSTSVRTIIDTESNKYGYQIVVKPEADTYSEGDIYYARVITNVSVNSDSPIYADAVVLAETKGQKHNLAVEKVVDMYNDNSDEYFFYDGKKDSDGELVKVQKISSDDLQYALGVIHDKIRGNKSIIEGLSITSQAKWRLSGETVQTEKQVDSLGFNLSSKPALPEFIE